MAPHPNAREPRATEERQERRRRFDGTLDRMAQLTLAVPDKIREENPDYDFRWVNDTGNRMHQLTAKDDWDRVDGMDPANVGTDREGKPQKAFLCKKLKAFVKEDQDRKMAVLREQERGLVQGERDGAATSALPESVTYQPGGNRIGRALSAP